VTMDSDFLRLARRLRDAEAAGEGYLLKSGGVMTGNLTAPHLILSAAGTPAGKAENAKGVWYRTDGLNRWSVISNSTDESGSNAGSNFAISRYDDAGKLIDTPLSISRATGNITITGTINTPVNGAVAMNVGNDARIADRNYPNTMFLEGQQNPDRGYINFSQSTGNLLGAINGGHLTWRGSRVWDAAAIPYEFGTWTLTLYGAASAGAPTYGARSGSFQRIGKMCLITGAVSISAKGGMAGALRIGGLPYVHAPGFASGLAVGAAGGYSTNKISLHIDGNTNYASLQAHNGPITAADIPEGGFALWGFAGVYHIK
jgi:hypothetical protein